MTVAKLSKALSLISRKWGPQNNRPSLVGLGSPFRGNDSNVLGNRYSFPYCQSQCEQAPLVYISVFCHDPSRTFIGLSQQRKVICLKNEFFVGLDPAIRVPHP